MARAVGSAGASVTSWNDGANRTYASVDFTSAAALVAALPPNARFHEPPLVVARITPADRSTLPALEAALAGGGRPCGVLSARREAAAIVVELDTARTPLSLIVALIDLETGPAPQRRIEPLLPVGDVALTAFTSFLLGEPQLDTSRLIETYIVPMLSVCP